MDTVTLYWGKGVIRFGEIESFTSIRLDKKGFYAILGAVYNPEKQKWGNIKLLYIGQAFDQTLRERIPQEHDAHECVFEYKKAHSGVGFVILIGTISEKSVERVSKEFFDDIECCLIYCNQPLCNTICKESYSGRDLQITNTGSIYPVKKECPCHET